MAANPTNTAKSVLTVQGIPDSVDDAVARLFTSRILGLVDKLMREANLQSVNITVAPSFAIDTVENERLTQEASNDELSISKRALSYQAHDPYFSFDLLVLPDEVVENIFVAVSLIELEKKVFDEWNLRSIEPFPRTSLNFHGPTGTGKTLAAHALAAKLKKRILTTSYAEIESKYHGEGPKNVEAIFFAAERDEALLFVDEADSLLSKRLSNVTQGSEQAINSMRSQLLICLERFRGIVIFATNFIESYDKAFRSRIRDIYFPNPDYKSRIEIWKRHFPNELPGLPDIALDELANNDWLNGRDVKNVVIDAALRAARDGDTFSMRHLREAIAQLKSSRGDGTDSADRVLTPKETDEISKKVKEGLSG